MVVIQPFEWLVFGLGALAGAVNLTGVLASISGTVSYYPLGSRDWQYYTFWGLSHVLNGSLLVLGILQFDALGLPPWTRLLGGALLVAGFLVVLVATRTLGVEQTRGMNEELQTEGVYRLSRNPQYVGYILATIGFPLVTDAPLVVVLCGLYLALWVSFPFAEEPWLSEQYGDVYEQYVIDVPRFVGGETITRLRGDDYSNN
ncbi:isoprenylcysteine carboxylmethyltransferase family protein [Halomicrobium sp. HM KBTZ05]|uniref:methyltransferase family protein n=1 Tax=Halomicrobium sp. HM KBTZ05 TaxID=3242663 RepID=UPI0035564FDE